MNKKPDKKPTTQSNTKAKPTVNVKAKVTTTKTATNAKTTSKTLIKTKETAATNAKTKPLEKNENILIKETAQSKPEMSETDKKLHKSATIIQKYWRRYHAKKVYLKIKSEKAEYEDKMRTLEQEAFLQMVKYEQEKEEKKRLKMLKEKQEKQKDEKRRKKFLEMAYDGNLQEMKFIIDEYSRELNTRDNMEQAQKKALIFKLIESKDPNNNSALSEASSSGNAEVVKFLLSSGADPNSRGSFNRTPLWRAAFASHLEASQVLLENGADPRLYANEGQRPLDVATDKNLIDLLQNWKIELTERMINQMRKANEQNAKEQMKSLDTLCKNAQNEYENAKKDFELIKTQLYKCNAELQRLHDEYLLNEKLYGELIETKENEKTDLKLKFEIMRETMVKKRMAYKEILNDSKKEKKQLKKDLMNNNNVNTNKNDDNNDSDNDNSDEDEVEEGVTKINIKEIDDIILRDLSGLVSKSNKWPLIIDQNDQACTFLRYRDTNYINCFDTKNMQMDRFRLALIGAIR